MNGPIAAPTSVLIVAHTHMVITSQNLFNVAGDSMRRLLPALSFVLLPLAFAHAGEAEQAPMVEDSSPSLYAPGTAHLDIALDDATYEMDLQTPAINLIGFEHPPVSAADQATLATARQLLAKPLTLFAIPPAAQCILAKTEMHSSLFGDKPEPGENANGADDPSGNTAPGGIAAHDEHSDIHVYYQFQCDNPEALKGLDLSQWFRTFPATHKVEVQLVTTVGEQSLGATPDDSQVQFDTSPQD
jgi:hypothetical protein